MKSAVENTFHRFFVCILLLFMAITIQADGGSVLNRKIQLSKKKETIYQLLRQVSDLSGYLFIYDSKIVNNDLVVKIPKGEYTLREAIYAITGNKQLQITVVGNHILLQQSDEKRRAQYVAPTKTETIHKPDFFTLSGTIYNNLTSEPIAYSSIGVSNTTIGTIANQNGEFKLILPDSLKESIVRLSHVGYESQEIEASLLAERDVRFSLNPKVIPLQEIVVRVVDPLQVLKEMQVKRELNYSKTPVYITAFYREGIDHKKKNIDLTEAVLKVYKTGYQNKSNTDQVKLVKMRHIISKQESDTLFTKMKSGINSCLMLDIMKDLPDFINPKDTETPFTYTHADISYIDDRRVNVISFEQKKNIEDPLYKGELFVDSENQSLVEAHFEINPDYIEKATDMYIYRRSKDVRLTLQRAYYTVSYKPQENGIYYISHIRGDLDFKVKKKRRLFSSPLHMWFEMVNCKVDTLGVNRFSRSERMSTQNIFSETKYDYDEFFWGHFNVILPEEKLKDIIINNLNSVVDNSLENGNK